MDIPQYIYIVVPCHEDDNASQVSLESSCGCHFEEDAAALDSRPRLSRWDSMEMKESKTSSPRMPQRGCAVPTGSSRWEAIPSPPLVSFDEEDTCKGRQENVSGRWASTSTGHCCDRPARMPAREAPASAAA